MIVLGVMGERQLRITENGRRHNRQPPNFKLGKQPVQQEKY